MTHGADLVEQLQRTAARTVRVLGGAAVADVAFELPTWYVLTLKLPAGRALGPAVPASMVRRADRISA